MRNFRINYNTGLGYFKNTDNRNIDEFDIEAEKMGKAEYNLNQLRPQYKKKRGKRSQNQVLNRQHIFG